MTTHFEDAARYAWSQLCEATGYPRAMLERDMRNVVLPATPERDAAFHRMIEESGQEVPPPVGLGFVGPEPLYAAMDIGGTRVQDIGAYLEEEEQWLGHETE